MGVLRIRAGKQLAGVLPPPPPPPPRKKNHLLPNLIGYWPGNEASGNSQDLHTNLLHMSDQNTVTSNPGKVYALARQHTRANTEFFHHADDALLRIGDTDLTVASWVYMDSKPAATGGGIVNKTEGAISQEYLLYWSQALDRFRWLVYGAAGLVGDVNASSLGAPSLATWYLVVAWHDSVNNLVKIQVNDGTVNQAATTGVPNSAAALFRIGHYAWGVSNYTWDGRIGPTALWKSAGGGGGCLSAAQRRALYNGGAGLRYDQLTW